MTRAAALLALGFAGVVASGAVAGAEWPRSVVGVADVRVVGDSGRASSRLVFAAAVEPLALRVEVVRGGRPQAIIWADDEGVLILVPDDPPLVHEGPATRATLAEALGLPFCPAELAYALRAGRGPSPRCADSDAPPKIQTRGGRVVGLSRSASGEAPGVRLTFSRFQRAGASAWPRRVRLAADGTEAVVDFSTVEERDRPPAAPAADSFGQPRRVSAAEIGRLLGLSVEGGP